MFPTIANNCFKKNGGEDLLALLDVKKTTTKHYKITGIGQYGLVYGVVDKPGPASSESRSRSQIISHGQSWHFNSM